MIALLFTFSMAMAQKNTSSVMTFEEYAKVRHDYPYIVELKIGRGSLLYYGSRHIFDPKHEQVAHIERLWKDFRPTVAYHESTGTSMDATAEAAVRTSGEPGLLRYLANRDKIPYFSLEPSRKDEIAKMLEVFTPEQIKVFFVLRQVPQFHGRHSTDEGDEFFVLRQVPQFPNRSSNAMIDEFFSTFLRNVSYMPGLETAGPSTIAELDKACLWLSPHLKNWRTADRSWSDPVANKAYTNQLARLSSEIRDKHMVMLLIDKVRQGERVFAVVGGSHVVMQEPALRAVANDSR